MKLLDNLRLELEEAGSDRERAAEIRCMIARELEQSGEYEEARDALGEHWPGVGKRPNLEGLGEHAAANLLLRAGALSSRFGKGQGIEGAQEKAIDLLSESARRFQTLAIQDKFAEAWAEIGLSYWHKGAYGEALIALDTALNLLEESDSEIRAVAIVRKALVLNSDGKHHKAFKLLQAEALWITSYNNYYINGLYHSTFANILLYLSVNEQQARARTGDSSEQSFADRALVEQSAAIFHFEQAGHKRHAARVRNNAGFLLFTLGRFEEACENLDRARNIFLELREKESAAQVDDTRARVLLAQGKAVEAERVARDSVAVLARGDDRAQLSWALTTHGIALARLGRSGEAKYQLDCAESEAAICGDREAAGQACLAIIEELGDVLPPPEVWKRYEQADQFLADTERPETIIRLRRCARITMTVCRRALKTDLKDGWAGCNLEEEVLRYEASLIDQAMAAEGGHITRAANRLGTTHQALRKIINGRQKILLGKKYSPRARRPNSANTSHAAHKGH